MIILPAIVTLEDAEIFLIDIIFIIEISMLASFTTVVMNRREVRKRMIYFRYGNYFTV